MAANEMITEMATATVMLTGGDAALRSAVQDAIASQATLRLVMVSDIERAIAFAEGNAVAAGIIHVVSGDDWRRAKDFLRNGRSGGRMVPTIIVHETLDSQHVLQLMQEGAAECLGRPLSISRLSLVLEMLTAPAVACPTEQEVPCAAEESGPIPANTALWASMQHVMDQVHRVAPLDTTILITGETGTGKTRLSRLIHELSPRRGKRFVAVNCGALSPTLVESELFGHVRGAFTGADREHAGKFAHCKDGTLLLDEVDSMSLEMQAKFLRVVEDRVFEPLGSDQSQQLEARLIVASNRMLEEDVAAGRFRSDLYYRLNVVAFQLPPLRERRSEILPLAETFATEFAERHGLTRPEITLAARRALQTYDWPGNVRQLRNVMERSVILSTGSAIDLGLLPDQLQADGKTTATSPAAVASQSLPETENKLAKARSCAERSQLREALRRNGNNRSRTAIDLGISRVALYKRLHKFGMI